VLLKHYTRNRSMILDLNADLDDNEKMDRLLSVFILGMIVAILVRFVESAYKTTLLH
jgi:Trm5-related predicted tRNA methylase